MIRNEVEFRQTLEQLAGMQRALADLAERVLPVNPTLFAVMAEGPLDYIRRFYDELEEYRASLVSHLAAASASAEGDAAVPAQMP